jgi:hypothetical protein
MQSVKRGALRIASVVSALSALTLAPTGEAFGRERPAQPLPPAPHRLMGAEWAGVPPDLSLQIATSEWLGGNGERESSGNILNPRKVKLCAHRSTFIDGAMAIHFGDRLKAVHDGPTKPPCHANPVSASSPKIRNVLPRDLVRQVQLEISFDEPILPPCPAHLRFRCAILENAWLQPPRTLAIIGIYLCKKIDRNYFYQETRDFIAAVRLYEEAERYSIENPSDLNAISRLDRARLDLVLAARSLRFIVGVLDL